MRGRNLSAGQGPKQELGGRKTSRFCLFFLFWPVKRKIPGVRGQSPRDCEVICIE
ncbi:hypothetical protein SIID45300_01734 [Candidatus Magnetaquicoccaceae bacterium FCR-1]|uniref:Uncharacterized protein n=1 Tax=Candidatus Magnetaquiglobus chichijimensis TaxID=3141448 RepID=A0ABQ0C941_9PROT